MGTNYYVVDRSEYCEHCGRGEEEIHIGKSSVGWCFYLHVYPEKGIHNWDDILNYIEDKQIYNEYRDDITKEEFIDIVTNRSWTPTKRVLEDTVEIGPNNLLRNKIDGDFCIGHGNGTYDYIARNFS